MRNDEPDRSQPPRGSITKTMKGHCQLARDYHAFLSRVDPIERWEEIAALREPLQTGRAHPDQMLKEKALRDYFPTLLHTVQKAHEYDAMAVRLGFRYAWSRLDMHAHLLDAMEVFFAKDRPDLVFEPGCFCSGPALFLPEYWGIKYAGLDMSPTAMDVCRMLANDNSVGQSLGLFSGNFLQLTTDQFQQMVPVPLDRTAVLLSNFISGTGRDWAIYPCLAQEACWLPYTSLIAYWISAGATVLLAERRGDPEWISKKIELWGREFVPNVQCRTLARFSTDITTNMTPTNPIGEWERSSAFVMAVGDPKVSVGAWGRLPKRARRK